MNIATPGINPGMNFHTVIPLVSLLRLMHFRITFAFFVFGGTWRVNDSCINYGAPMHNQSSLIQTAFYVGKNFLADMVFFKKMPEFQ